MQKMSIRARLYSSGRGVELSWHNNTFVALEPVDYTGELWLAPTLTDLQVNGYATTSFRVADLTLAEMQRAVAALQRDGCGSFFPTLVTAEWESIVTNLRLMYRWCQESAPLRRAVAGWHIEGPFLSPVTGFRGAHRGACMISPERHHLEELRASVGDDPILLTVAPETPGVIELIPVARSLGMVVSLGHTNASRSEIDASVAAGATAFTHLANGCPELLDRHDNIIIRCVDTPQLHPGLIPDAIHVAPPLFRLLHRAVDTESLWFTTDASLAAGMLPGRFMFGDVEVEVKEDQVVRKPGEVNFAGSALRPLEGIFRAAEMLGCSWREVWPRYSVQPRRLMGLEQEELAVGMPANFCLLDFSSESAPTVSTYIAGERVATLPAVPWMAGAGIAAEVF